MEITETNEVEVANKVNVGWTEGLGPNGSNPKTPRDSGFSLFAFDEEWKIPTVENRIKAQFEQKVRGDHLKAIKLAESLDPATAEQMRDEWKKAFSDGLYNWEDSISDPKNFISQWKATVKGAIYLMYLLLRRCHPDMTEKRATEICVDNPKDWMTAYCWALGVPVPPKVEDLAPRQDSKNAQAPKSGATTEG